MNNIFYSDLHIHTNLSDCAPATTEASSYLPFCEEENVKIIGFSNHVYTDDEEKLNRLLQFKNEIRELQKNTSCKLLFGAEVETVYHLPPNLSAEVSKEFDYILLSPSHIMNMPWFYKSYDLSSPDKIRELMVKNFIRACSFDFNAPTGICHPLYPICTGEWEEEIVRGISDSTLSDCFSLAKKKNYSIEIHACLYRNDTKKNADGLSEAYMHILSCAKSEGCFFHFGTDSHYPEAFINRHKYLYMAAEKLALTSDDIWEIAK